MQFPFQPFTSTALTLHFRYVPWNLHEQERGKFDFSRNLDLEYVVQTALLLNTAVLRGGGVCQFWMKMSFPASEAKSVP